MDKTLARGALGFLNGVISVLYMIWKLWTRQKEILMVFVYPCENDGIVGYRIHMKKRTGRISTCDVSLLFLVFQK